MNLRSYKKLRDSGLLVLPPHRKKPGINIDVLLQLYLGKLIMMLSVETTYNHMVLKVGLYYTVIYNNIVVN